MNQEIATPHLALAREIAARYAVLPETIAVALGGSVTAGEATTGSDIDMYVYSAEPIPESARVAIASTGASRVEALNNFWESGDEWVDALTGISVDVMFRRPEWIEDQIDRVLKRHEASVGYSTCFWYNVLTSHALYDPDGWYQSLVDHAQQPYPDPLVWSIIEKNHPILRSTISSYSHQIERAISKQDLVSINHRTAALLASYFDILFALNHQPHPGEKRLVSFARQHCQFLPKHFEEEVNNLVNAAAVPGELVSQQVDTLVDGLDTLLKRLGYAQLLRPESN